MTKLMTDSVTGEPIWGVQTCVHCGRPSSPDDNECPATSAFDHLDPLTRQHADHDQEMFEGALREYPPVDADAARSDVREHLHRATAERMRALRLVAECWTRYGVDLSGELDG